MIAFLQRVSQADVRVDAKQVAKIGLGLMVLLCAERTDTEVEADQLLQKLLNYRVFADNDGKMNVSLLQLAEMNVRMQVGPDIGLLIVPQFTLAADTQSGTRPSFAPAAAPVRARQLFDYFVAQGLARKIPALSIETGVFGAHMQVSIVNDGPVSFWLQTRKSTPLRPPAAVN
jgi:D-aminoacyl-tRNA deacylase